MTGTYQVLDQDKGPEYGTPFSPTSPKSGDTTETNDLGDHSGDLSPRSRSPECLLPENGLIENEHEPEEKEPSPSMFDFSTNSGRQLHLILHLNTVLILVNPIGVVF